MALRLLVTLRLWRRVRLKRRRMGPRPRSLLPSLLVTLLQGPRRMLLRLPLLRMGLLPLRNIPLPPLRGRLQTLRLPPLPLHSRRVWPLLLRRMLLTACGRSCPALCQRLRAMRMMLLILLLPPPSPHRMRRLWWRMVCRMRPRR